MLFSELEMGCPSLLKFSETKKKKKKKPPHLIILIQASECARKIKVQAVTGFCVFLLKLLIAFPQHSPSLFIKIFRLTLSSDKGVWTT